jgi:hypothetical protein
MKRISLLAVVVLFALCALSACERNPVLRKGMNEFNDFLQRNNYASLANLCSDYYLLENQSKKSRESATCSAFTRDLALQSRQEGFIGHATFNHFREKQLWQDWRDYMKNTARSAATES